METRQRAGAKPRGSLGHRDSGRSLKLIWARPAPMSTCSPFGGSPGFCSNRTETTRRSRRGPRGTRRTRLGCRHRRAIQSAPQDALRQRRRAIGILQIAELKIGQFFWHRQPIGCQAINGALELDISPLRAHNRVRLQEGKHRHRNHSATGHEREPRQLKPARLHASAPW